MSNSLHKFHLEPAALGAETDAFVSESPQGTPFLNSHFLGPLQKNGYKCVFYWIYKKTDLRGLLHIPLMDENGLFDLVVYSGILFPPPHPKQTRFRQLDEQFVISELVAKELPNLIPHGQSLVFNLHPTLNDIRAWSWHNYNETEAPKYSIAPQYTGTLQTGGLRGKALEEYLMNEMATSRRKRIRLSIKLGEHTREDTDIYPLLENYRIRMKNQNQTPNPTLLEAMKNAMESCIQSGTGYFLRTNNSQDEYLAGSFLLIQKDIAINVWGSISQHLDSVSAGTRLIMDSILILAEKGVTTIDFEGLNSPQRGFFKQSFGIEPQLYFQIAYPA